MRNKFKIVLNTDDVVHNRKILSVKLAVWKKLISCSAYEQIPITKIIDKAITKYIEENNYNVEDMFKDNLEVKQILYRENKPTAIDYKFDNYY